MRRRPVRWLIAAALATALVIGLWPSPHASTTSTGHPSTSTVSNVEPTTPSKHIAPPIAVVPSTLQPPVGSPPPNGPPPSKQLTPAGPRAFADRLRLKPSAPEHDPVVNLVRDYRTDELRLLAEVRKRTGRPPSAGVVDIIRRHRAGEATPTLRAEAMRLFADDLPTRIAVLHWLGTETPEAPAPHRGDLRLPGRPVPR